MRREKTEEEVNELQNKSKTLEVSLWDPAHHDISVAQCFILELFFLSLDIEQLQEVKASFSIEKTCGKAQMRLFCVENASNI